MKKINQTRKKGTQAVGLLLIIGISVYIGFTPLFELVNGGVAGAVIGAVLVTAPWNNDLRMTYILIGIVGAFFTSLASISIRQLSKDHDKYVIIASFLNLI